MTTLALPTFSGTSGQAFDANWTTDPGSPAGSVTQDGAGGGVLQASNASAWNASTPTARYTGLAALQDIEIDFDFDVTLIQFWPTVGLRTTAKTIQSDGGFSVGVNLQFAIAANTWSVFLGNGTKISGSTDPSFTYAATGNHCKFRVVGTNALVKLWTGATEPGWTTFTGATASTGQVGFTTGQGGDTTARPFKLRNLTITDATDTVAALYRPMLLGF